jgi:TetR/AcrR family transcriptional regulator
MASPRRSPKPDERQRDAERTRRALLDAALAEFAAKGRAGARVSGIAERAGVNKQLISYYFGGKDGLYDAIIDAWHAQEASFGGPDVSLEDLASRYLRSGQEQLELQRLFVRESLDADLGEVAHEPDAPEIEDLRRRQAAGELGEDLDPAFVLLVLQAAVVARVIFPNDVKRYLGLDPASPEYLEHADEQLRRIVRRLAGPGTDGG